jgi:hypothetical protein
MIAIVIACISFSGCRKKMDVIENRTEFKNILYTAKMQPLSNGGKTLTFQYVISTLDNTNILQYNILNQKEYTNRIYYFSYKAANDFWIESGGLIIPCEGAIFERNYNLTKDITLTLTFDVTQLRDPKEVTLAFNASVFNVAPIKLKFKTQ